MTLVQPIWLILLIPLAAAMWTWRLPGRALLAMRAVTVVLVVLAICGLAIEMPSRDGTVVIVADRSLSMPAGAEAQQLEVIGLVQDKRSPRDGLGVVVFGQDNAIELTPRGGQFGDFIAKVDAEGSDLASAIEIATALVPPESPGRILVLSDGRYTGRTPLVTTSGAATRDISIDYRCIQRPATSDLAIRRVQAPGGVAAGESFLITAWVRSPVSQTITYELLRGSSRLASGERDVRAGVTRLVFRDRAGEGGMGQYLLRVTGTGEDPVPENNRARLLVGVRGAKPLLCVTPKGRSGLTAILRSGGVDLIARPPEQCEWSLADLSQFSGVLIENTPADTIGVSGMEAIAGWVRYTGAGLMTTGGGNAYGPGGYFRSPLDEVLPVSMELRREHRKLALAMVVALDRSGSMAMPIGGGRTKMDLANLATAEVLTMLSAMDEFGCIAVDSTPHVVSDLAAVTDHASVRRKVLGIRSEGGGIFVYEALAAASKMLTKAQAGTRHIILFADAADAEEPGNYAKLLESCRRANITVSVIGLGTPGDVDADLLRDIAKRGGGRCMFTTSPEQLPRLFAQDTLVVARSSFVNEVTPVKTVGGMATLAGMSFSDIPSVGGYNLCYLRPEATLGVVTTDEYGAPLVASWQVGSGRALCYTGEADGKFTGPIAGWTKAGDFFTSLARWTVGEQSDLPAEMALTQDVVDGVCRIRLHLSPGRGELAFSGMPAVTTLREHKGSQPSAKQAQMRWESADILEVSVSLTGSDTALSSVEIPSVGRFTLAPVCLPYSPEYEPDDDRQGPETLARLARLTGGEERLDLGGIWADLPAHTRLVNLSPWLLGVAALLLLAEVLERRTGALVGATVWLAGRLKRRRRAKPSATAPRETGKVVTSVAGPPVDGTKASPDKATEEAPAENAPPSGSETSDDDMDDLFRRARNRAKGRTGRNRP